MNIFTEEFSKTLEEMIENQHSKRVKTQISEQLSKLEIGYEERIIIFKNLIKHRKTIHQAVYLKDVYFWFPECKSPETYGPTQVPQYFLEKGLEAFIAQLIKRKDTVSNSYQR